jgi:ATP-dependent DNA helicase PIF1
MEDFDAEQLSVYGLDYKITNKGFYVRPQYKKPDGSDYTQWSNVRTKRGKTILNYATGGDVSLLYELPQNLPRNVLAEISFNDMYIGEKTGDALQAIIKPLAEQGRLIINIKIGGEFKRFKAAKIITSETNTGDYFQMVHTLLKIMDDIDYHDGSDILIQVVLLPNENPGLRNIRDGKFNCVILPVILLLQKQKQSKANQSRINQLMAYHHQVRDTGLDNDGIHRVSMIARINIAIYDKCGQLWHKFTTAKDRKTLLLDVHNSHAEVRNNKELLQQVYNNQQKSEFNLVLAEPVELEIFKEQEVVWVTPDELHIKIGQHLDGHIISSKGFPKALITTTHIYKTKFDEHEEYPDSFTDGGVGKAKFLEQVPQMKKDVKINSILWDADVSGFYMRTGGSHHNNIKFDMNHAYKSFKNSGIFKGFPERLDTVLSFKKPDGTYPTASEADFFRHNGLVYIEYLTLDIERLMTAHLVNTKTKTYPRIYYECSGWYPIEIVEEIFKLYGVDPIVKAIAIGEDTFDIDVSQMTNSQFRSFVGKTTSKYVSDTWRTTNEDEYLRALFQLQDNLIGVKSTQVDTGCVRGIQSVMKTLAYSIEYTDPNKTPWQCPVVAVYVKAHQKLQLFKQYNLLVDNGILPRYVSVDGIEISGNQPAAIPLFDMVNWKREEIKPAAFNHVQVIERVVKPFNTSELPPYNKNTEPLPQLLHLAGSGGNGKTELVVKLSQIYDNICYTATTHNACSELEIRGKKLGLPIKAETFHRIFGIGTKFPQIPNASVFVIEEASMLSDEHLQIIDARLREKFSAHKPFGGKKIILVGDFWQLPVLSPATPLYDPWTDIKTPLYSLFTLRELTENWRQKADPTFYNLCQRLRSKLSEDEAAEILEELNVRCVYDEEGETYVPGVYSINDMYMSGVNAQVDSINKSKYGGIILKVGRKIINTKTTFKGGVKIPNGRIGVVAEVAEEHFTIAFQGIGLVEFKITQTDQFKPAYAVTVHKAQGRTLSGNVVINPSRLFDKNHLYVALTRAISFDNVYLTSPITLKMLAKTCFVIEAPAAEVI